MHVSTYQLTFISICSKRTTVDCVKLFKPEIIGIKVIKSTSIFVTPGVHGDLRILPEAHTSLYLGCEWAEFQGWRGYSRKDSDYQRVYPCTHLYPNSASTGIDDIIEMRRKKDVPVFLCDFIKAF